jgi:putative heme-binding domain-containing protein
MIAPHWERRDNSEVIRPDAARVALILVVGAGADDPLPRTMPRAPADALSTFQVQGGFRLELLAAEPLVMSPVAAAYDEDGRLFVVEMTDYPHVDPANDKPFTDNTDPPIGRVRLLIDLDDDGTFDESQIEEILLSIVDPNREVSPEFVEYAIALDDGRVVTGLVAVETPASVTLRGREGAEQTILRHNFAEIAGTGKSLMPEGLEKTITVPEMADLITYVLKVED